MRTIPDVHHLILMNAISLLAVNYERLLKDREDIIHQLQQENENQRQIFKRTLSEKQEREHHVQEQLTKLTSELAELQNEVVNLSESYITFTFLLLFHDKILYFYRASK